MTHLMITFQTGSESRTSYLSSRSQHGLEWWREISPAGSEPMSVCMHVCIHACMSVCIMSTCYYAYVCVYVRVLLTPLRSLHGCHPLRHTLVGQPVLSGRVGSTPPPTRKKGDRSPRQHRASRAVRYGLCGFWRRRPVGARSVFVPTV